MQIILMERVANLGNLGDVVKVKEGYARNFLIPKGKAKRATPDNLKLIEAKRAELEKLEGERLVAARATAAKLDGVAVQIARRAGPEGHLFGSVSNLDIIEALAGQGFSIEKSGVHLPEGPLKNVGEYAISVSVHPEVEVSIKINVVAE
ncbi:MAG: 50S ribosomal protein L9 [Burkholderiales bacterium]|nr:MAG: 50S ribosomal protein L9 [Burkholderiales bacterium]